MADESQLGNNNNWWDSSRTTRFDESTQTPSSSATPPSFGWPTEMVDNINNKAARTLSSVDSLSVSGSSIFLSDVRSLPPPSTIQESSSTTATASAGALRDPNLQIMGLGLSSHGMDWNNQPVFRDEKAENSSFRSMLQEGMSSNTYFHHQESVVPSTHDHWRHNKLYSAATNNSEDSSINDYKQLTQQRGFSLDQPYTDPGAATDTFPGDVSATAYGNQPMFQQPSSYQTSYSSLNNSGELMMQNVSNKFPQDTVGQLQFSNSTPFWNATAAAMNDVRSSFFPSLQAPVAIQTFDEKQKDTSEEVRHSGATIKKSCSETSNKRPRNESPSPLPAFKVRKEKMGDRITALQQLVSPFGKTDTASVLSEAIEYIKFLHEQVNVLSTPYMRSGNFVQNQQHSCHDNKAQDPEAEKQDLRSRGLCLVPVSSTFPVTHETTVDFWTPTFGGTFR